MAKTVTSAFEQFASNLNITGLQAETVSDRQTRVRSNVVKSLYVIDDFLAGSYKRITMIAPLRDADVDVFIVLDSTLYAAPPYGPASVLAKLQRVIQNSYKETTDASRNRHAITIKFTDFKVDVVPAFNSQAGHYLIPDPVRQEWIHSNPKTHLTLWTQSNTQNGGKLVPFIKMIK